MKRILLLLSILSLFAYGCNRDQQEPAGGGMGMEEEQQRLDDVQALPESDVESVEPAMQEDSEIQRMEETDPVMDSDPALESDPAMESDEAFDARPGMQEEQTRFEDSESLDMTDERDPAMDPGADTVSEPIE